MVFRTTGVLAWTSRTPPPIEAHGFISLCRKKLGNTLECPQTTPLLTHRVDKKCGHEKADSYANSNLDHGRRNVEDDGVQTISGSLFMD